MTRACIISKEPGAEVDKTSLHLEKQKKMNEGRKQGISFL